MYDPLNSRNRCLALQKLRESADCDALVLLLGSDGRGNRGSELAFLWAVLGRGGVELALEELNYDRLGKELDV